MLLGLIAILFNILLGVILFLLGIMIKVTDLNTYFYNIAQVFDKVGNVVGYPVWNIILITKDGYMFGNSKEDMSSVLGKNQEKGTLKGLGIWLDKKLNKIQTNHTINAIDNNV